MTANILPYHYTSEEIYQKEKRKIFHNNWIFFCFKSDLVNHNDFVSGEVGEIPVVVQNFNGQIKALHNVCSHRFSILQVEKSGNRGLFCPYHGWSYDKTGIPVGIPKRPFFKDFSNQELCQLKLKEFYVDYCGDLCFVHIDEPQSTLKDFLSDFYNEISDISFCKSNLIDKNNFQIKANWKITLENTLESYHVNLVHPETFGSLGAKGTLFDFAKNHSSWESNLNLSENDPKLEKIHNLFSNRRYKINGYKHFLLYPNLLISSSYGVSYNFSILTPKSKDETDFTSLVFLSEPEINNNLVEVYSKYLIDFNRKVFNEDKIICEQVQKGVLSSEKTGILSLEEERVHSFQKIYINQLN